MESTRFNATQSDKKEEDSKLLKFLREIGPELAGPYFDVLNETGARILKSDKVIDQKFASYVKKVNDPEIIRLHLLFIAENPDAIGLLTDPKLLERADFIKTMKIRGLTTSVKPQLGSQNILTINDSDLSALKWYLTDILKTGRVDLLTSDSFVESTRKMEYYVRSLYYEKIAENPNAIDLFTNGLVLGCAEFLNKLEILGTLTGVSGLSDVNKYLNLLVKTKSDSEALNVLTSKPFKKFIINALYIYDSSGKLTDGASLFFDIAEKHPEVLKLFAGRSLDNVELTKPFDEIEDTKVRSQLLNCVREATA